MLHIFRVFHCADTVLVQYGLEAVSSSFGVGVFASGLQCTSPSLPADIALLKPYLAIVLPVVALSVLEIVWEVSGDNVCDPRAHLEPVARYCCTSSHHQDLFTDEDGLIMFCI